MPSNLLRRISILLYSLKRLYGLPITIFVPGDDSYNLETGSVSRTYTRYRVAKAIILPSKETRNFVQKPGGYFDVDERSIVIDRKDIDIELDLNMHLEYANRRFEFSKILETEDNKAYVLIVKKLSGSSTIAISETITTTINLNQQVDYTKVPV